jgi:hypothetical protein
VYIKLFMLAQSPFFQPVRPSIFETLHASLSTNLAMQSSGLCASSNIPLPNCFQRPKVYAPSRGDAVSGWCCRTA